MKHDKNEAINEFIEMIKKSWTYERLTTEEKQRFLNTIEWGKQQGIIKGSWLERWHILQLTYDSFLNALDYKPTGWREPDDDYLPF